MFTLVQATGGSAIDQSVKALGMANEYLKRKNCSWNQAILQPNLHASVKVRHGVTRRQLV
jgi:stage V sporulation protein SpoVS